MICKDQELSQYVQLNQIVGLELGGTWKYDVPVNPDNTVSSNVTVFPAGSQYSGARIFNAFKAFAEASTAYNIIYKGVSSMKFVFRYTGHVDSCVGSQEKTVVIVVW
jgi:hypothetical protein